LTTRIRVLTRDKLRIFIKRRFRITVWVVIVYVAASGVAFLLAALLQCIPISQFALFHGSCQSPPLDYELGKLTYDLGGSFDRSIPAKCLDLNVVAFSNAGVGISQDIIILILPFPEIVHLTMSTRKKFSMVAMLLLGSFACLTSIIRLNYLHTFASSTDETCRQPERKTINGTKTDLEVGDNQEGSLWSLAEQSVAMMCACMPAIRKLLSSYWPTVFGFQSCTTATLESPRPLSLYPLSTISSKRRRSTIMTGDEVFRPNNEEIYAVVEPANGFGSPFRCTFEASEEISEVGNPVVVTILILTLSDRKPTFCSDEDVTIGIRETSGFDFTKILSSAL
jgi:hypothetical protein